ncbi:hypothetical protein HD806DRAFT_545043 [Xylariaceae sp. AK1471]|nr:hypothetical protein HD806DRAFT_545043 [Xylariaceae sp. AK1471]
MDDAPEENRFQEWRSILTLIVFFLVNLIVIYPFYIPFYVPYRIFQPVRACLVYLLSLPDKNGRDVLGEADSGKSNSKRFQRISIPVSLTTAPLAAVFFLLATTAMTPEELRGGIRGSNNLIPLDIVAFALTIGYISGSIDASGFLRYLAFRVLRAYGRAGHRLFLYLYCLFFLAGFLFGNDPIIQMGMLVLTYMLNISSNIVHPRAWISMQYAIVNIASTIFVSSGTTNVIIASAFNIGFAEYAANTVVPVAVTAIVLFPFLLYIVFADESLIPTAIQLHELHEEARGRTPTNPNIESEHSTSLEDTLNPFLDKLSALVGIILMIVTLVVLLALSAVTLNNKEIPVFWVTSPAAFLMLCWDVIWSWIHRREVRAIGLRARREKEHEAARRVYEFVLSAPQSDTALHNRFQTQTGVELQHTESSGTATGQRETSNISAGRRAEDEETSMIHQQRRCAGKLNDIKNPGPSNTTIIVDVQQLLTSTSSKNNPKDELKLQSAQLGGPPIQHQDSKDETKPTPKQELGGVSTPKSIHLANAILVKEEPSPELEPARMSGHEPRQPRPLSAKLSESDSRFKKAVSLSNNEHPKPIVLAAKAWLEETFVTAMVVLRRLPFSVVPFAIPTFVLVQALVDKGWVVLFARWWNAWVIKTGTVGAVGGMGFLSVVLSNFAGTNIGATALLCRVLQTWQQMHSASESAGPPPDPISDRTWWGAVYAMALGVNYGAFSISFGASLAGISWREDLARKRIFVRRGEFASVNLPIISMAMAIGCAVLVGEVYITR